MAGTSEIQKIISFGIAIAESAEAMQSQENKWSKAACLFQAVDDALELITLDLTRLSDQWSSLGDDEWSQILIDSKEAFDLQDNLLEAKIESSFYSAIGIVGQMQNLGKIWAIA
jgi:hypothetical protein